MSEVDGRRPFAIYDFSPSMTKQSFAEECDINEILRRAKNGQDISGSVIDRVARYGDFSNVPSYQEALNLVKNANGMFMSLDAHVRERFNNDPVKMIAFLQNADNYDEAVKLGLVVAKPAEPADGSAQPITSSDTKSGEAKPI